MTPVRITVVGGCGHVGLPLALVFASKGFQVDVLDIDTRAVAEVNAGRLRFMERGAEELLRAHAGRNFTATTEASVVSRSEVVICIVGTPIDEHLNPQVDKLLDVMEGLKPFLRAGQLFVLRSTVYPGATDRMGRWFSDHDLPVDVAYCPERVAQGFAIEEIQTLPQIVSGTTPQALARARELFGSIAKKTIELSPREAELAKLFCNTWRYITFAVANQLYGLCAHHGIDYAEVRAAIVDDYPRMRGLPSAGFAAGPCLFKDTMQLAAFYNNEFSLGQAAMLVNEGFPRLLMEQLRSVGLADKTVGLLGMAFKGDNDDTRESLAFKMKKLLELECRRVLCTDPFVRAPWIIQLEQVLEESQVLVVGTPHSAYRSIRARVPVLDPWNHLGSGGLLR